MMSRDTTRLHALHAALMPDYNRAAAIYWWSLIVMGASVMAVAAFEASLRPLPVLLQIAAVCAGSMLAGAFPVRLPGHTCSVSAAEIFIFLALLYVGLDAAVLAAAAEAFVASARTSKRWTSRLVSPAVAAFSMAVTGWAFLLVADSLGSRQLHDAGTLLGLLPAAAVVHFLLTGWLVRMVLHLKADKPMRLRVLLGDFGWIGSTYAANAFIAGLLYLTARHAGAIVLLAAGPMIALLLTTVHFHFRQRQAEAAEAQARVDAAEAIAAQTARHNAELRRIADRDGMASVVDRRRFDECLAEVLAAQARVHRGFAVMHVEIDGFRRINETLGQSAGDELLVHAASRMQRRLRAYDLVGKLGDGGFVVLLKDLHREHVLAVARRLVEGLGQPYAVGVTVECAASLGITLGEYGYQAPNDMLRDAAAAMTQAKSLGGARYVMHHPDVLQRTAVPERNALLGA
jgi:diguanylate cyclase (GGDEF)-like protein